MSKNSSRRRIYQLNCGSVHFQLHFEFIWDKIQLYDDLRTSSCVGWELYRLSL